MRAPNRFFKNPVQSIHLKDRLVREIGRSVVGDRTCRERLEAILGSQNGARLRVTAAKALGAVATQAGTKEMLVAVLRNDQDDEVRGACASALRDAAEQDPAVAEELLGTLKSRASDLVRSDAVYGLGKVAVSRDGIRKALEDILCSDSESEIVRIACAWVLDEQIAAGATIVSVLKSWLQSPPTLLCRRVASEILATAMADERLEWDHGVIERAETVLMGLDDPGQCALRSLELIATAREVRRGLRLENVLRDSLRPVADAIDLAFVFGSTARNRQTEQSDIDLLIIGRATLKTIAGPLHQAEKVLGRRISPVIYTLAAFQDRYQHGDPFLLDVCRREKIPVIHKTKIATHKEIEDELRAMVAQRMAAKP